MFRAIRFITLSLILLISCTASSQTIVYECTTKVADALLKHYPKDTQNSVYIDWNIIISEEGHYVSRFEWREMKPNSRYIENYTNRVIKLRNKTFTLVMPHDDLYFYNAQDFYDNKRRNYRLYYDGGPFIWVYHKTGKIKIQEPWQSIKL